MPICAKKIPWTPEKPGGGVLGQLAHSGLGGRHSSHDKSHKGSVGGRELAFWGEAPPPSPLFLFGVFWLNIESERWLPGEPTVTSSPLPFFPSPPAIHAPPHPLFQWRWLWVLISGNLWVCPAWKLRVCSKPVPLPMQEGSVPQMIACLH